MDLAKFLEARIGEVERAAGAVAVACRDVRMPWPPEQAQGRGGPALTDFLRHFGEMRMLREVDAKQMILAEHASAHNQRGDTLCFTCTEGPWPCRTIALLAAVYSDHEDFDEGWRP